MDVTHWAYGHLTAAALLADTDADISTWPVADTELLADADWPVDDSDWVVTSAPASNANAQIYRGLDGTRRGQGMRNGALFVPGCTADKIAYLRTEKFPGGVYTAPATIRYRDFELGGYRVVQCLIDRPADLDNAEYNDGTYRIGIAFRWLRGADAPSGV